MKKMGAGFGENSVILVAGLFILGVLGRVALADCPNFETVLVASFLASILINSKFAVLISLSIMIVSDVLVGNAILIGAKMNQIVIFTYSGFALVSLIGILARKGIRSSLSAINPRSVLISAGLGAAFAIAYDAWTNLGWWYLLYPRTLENLVSVYAAGLPFMLYHIASGMATFVLIGLPVVSIVSSKNDADCAKREVCGEMAKSQAFGNCVAAAMFIALALISFVP